jgi:hypothetical protein
MTIAEIAKIRDKIRPVLDPIRRRLSWRICDERRRCQRCCVPWVSIGSDGSALNLEFPGKPHPRSFGTNPRVLGKYSRDENVLTLEDAVRKMTSAGAGVGLERSRPVARRLLGRCGAIRCRHRGRHGDLR